MYTKIYEKGDYKKQKAKIRSVNTICLTFYRWSLEVKDYECRNTLGDGNLLDENRLSYVVVLPLQWRLTLKVERSSVNKRTERVILLRSTVHFLQVHRFSSPVEDTLSVTRWLRDSGCQTLLDLRRLSMTFSHRHLGRGLLFSLLWRLGNIGTLSVT